MDRLQSTLYDAHSETQPGPVYETIRFEELSFQQKPATTTVCVFNVPDEFDRFIGSALYEKSRFRLPPRAHALRVFYTFKSVYYCVWHVVTTTTI